jgi:hypothetical protein
MSQLARGHVWKAAEALDALAAIGPLLRGSDSRLRGMVRPASAALAGTRLTVWPRSSEELGGDREDVADALQVFGWHLLPISDSGADRLYADGGAQTANLTPARLSHGSSGGCLACCSWWPPERRVGGV